MGASNIRGITIEIDGNTTKLSQSLKNVDKSIKDTQKSLKDVDKLLKLDPKNTELLTQKQKLLKDAIGETKDRLQQLKDAQGQVSQGTPEWDGLQREIIETEQNLKSLEQEYRNFGSVSAQQLKAVGEDMQAVGDKISGAGKALAPVSAAAAGGLTYAVKTAADFDTTMSKVQAISGASADQMELLSAAAREAGATTKFSASEAGDALTYMAMAGWKTNDMLGGLSGIMNLSAADGLDLATTSDIVTDGLTAFGMTAEESGHFANVLAAASTNANTNVSMLGESFKYVGPVAGAMNYSIEDMSVALGLMANSGIKGSQAGASLRNIIQRMAKPTKESEAAMTRLGLSLQDDEGKMYSFMEIMEQLRDSMQGINMPTEEYLELCEQMDAALKNGEITQKKYNEVMEEAAQQAFGAEGAEKARAAAMLGGARAMAGLLAIANASEKDFEDLCKAVDNSSQTMAMLTDGSIVPLNEALESGAEIMATYEGQAEAMAAVMQNNLNGQITELKSAIDEAAISIGSALMPVIQTGTGKIKGLVDGFNSLDSSAKSVIAVIGVVVAALAPVLIIIGTLVHSIGSILTAISAVQGFLATTLTPAVTAVLAPILAAVAAIAAVIAVLALLYKHNEDFRNRVNEIWAEVQEIIQGVVAVIQQVIQAFVDAAAQLWATWGDEIIATAQAAWDMVFDLINAVLDIIQAAIELFVQVAQQIWQRWGDNILHIAQTVWNFINTVISTALKIIQDVIRIVTAAISGDWSTVWEGIKQLAFDIWEGIKNIINAALAVVKSVISTGLEIVKTVWHTAWEWVSAKLSEIWEKIKATAAELLAGIQETIGEVYTTITTKIGEAVEWIKSLPAQALQWGKDLIGNFVDGIKEKWEEVKDAVTDIAEGIADFIGFSEPDKGPLKDFHTFAPDMMKLYAQGISDNMYLVTDQMQQLAGSMAAAAQRPASIYLTNNTVLNGRVIASAVNEELGFLL